MKLALQRAADLPLYRQVANQLRDRIKSGALPAGSRLPAVRHLALELGLTRLTVQTAYAELQAEGLIEAYVGRGTFVTTQYLPVAPLGTVPPPRTPWLDNTLLADMMRMNEQPQLLSFAQAAPALESYPAREFARALKTVMADPMALGYGPAQGETVLREQTARLLLDRGLIASPDSIMITAGAQQAIDLALRAFVQPGEVVLVEEPTYPGMVELAAQRGQQLVGIPLDAAGLDMAALEAACQTYRPRLLYTVPTFQNPTGLSLSPERRKELLALARKYNLLIVEDDLNALLNLSEAPPSPLKAYDEDGRVILITSYSKILAPGLRIGTIVASQTQLPALLVAKRSSDLVSSPLLQRALAEYMRWGYLDQHLKSVRALYLERRNTMLMALSQNMPGCTWTKPEGGLCIWVRLPDGVDEAAFCNEATVRGVGIAPGRAFFVQPKLETFIRLGYGSQNSHNIQQGVAILGRLLQDTLRQRNWLAARAARETSPLV